MIYNQLVIGCYRSCAIPLVYILDIIYPLYIIIYIYLVGDAITIFKNMKVRFWIIIPNLVGENRKCSKPPTSIYIYNVKLGSVNPAGLINLLCPQKKQSNLKTGGPPRINKLFG